jgi:mxaJ protein
MRAMVFFLAVSVMVSGCGASHAASGARSDPLRICSDPNNLPFSNRAGEGFENRIADLLARDLGTEVRYSWWAQRRGFLRNTLNARLCDVVMGYPAAAGPVLTTKPYYRSTYVFLTRSARRLRLTSFNEPILRRLRIGVQLIGDDGANSPPAHALSRRGIVRNLVGFTVYGDYRTNSPPSAIVAAVAHGDVDAAAVWGPLAGYFAPLQSEPLDVVPVSPATDANLPQVFDISMAVRRDDDARRRQLDGFIERHRADIDRVLADYRVPRVESEP